MKTKMVVGSSFCLSLAFGMSLGAMAASEVTVQSVYDDVLYWMRGTYNRESADLLLIRNNEVEHSLALGEAEKTAAYHTISVENSNGNDLRHDILDVVCPYADTMLKNRSAIYFEQPTRQDGTEALTRCILMNNGVSPDWSADNTKPYTVLLRYKMQSKLCASSTSTLLLKFGYGWSEDSGFILCLNGDESNQSVGVTRGSWSEFSFSDMQATADTQLSCGKWVDLALVFTPSVVTLYTCPQGGRLCKQATSQIPLSWSKGLKQTWLGGDVNTPSWGYKTIADGQKNAFRGWIQQFAVWGKALTEDEIKEAFSDGCHEGDLLRFGVANDSALEFTGVDAASAVQSSTDADQATDWRFFPPALTTARPSAEVRFTVEDGRLSLGDQMLKIKSTAASATSGALTVVLNGSTLAEEGALAPGGTLAVPVPLSALAMGANVLTLTRTDGGADDLTIDCLALGATEVGPYVYRAGAVKDDPYADAFGWWRSPCDVNGNHWFDEGSKELRNSLLASDRVASHATHSWINSQWYITAITNVDVTCPAGGVVLTDEPCLYFNQRSWYDESDEKWHGTYGTTYQRQFVATNGNSYAVSMRIKIDSLMKGDAGDSIVFGFGYNYSKETGIRLKATTYGGTTANMSLMLEHGSWVGSQYAHKLQATQTGPAANRIAVGKWMDVAVVVSNGFARVYTQTEGGELVEQGPFSLAATKNPGGDVLALGGPGTSASETGLNTDCTYFRGWMHNVAIWPRWLGREEVVQAFRYPQPDLVRIGVGNGTDDEFADDERPETISSERPYAVAFDVSAEEVGKNQLFRLVALPGSVETAQIRLAVNGTLVANYTEENVWKDSFAPDVNGVYEIGVRHELLKAGQNTLTVSVDPDHEGAVGIDSLLFGNCGRRIRVRTGLGLSIIVR